MHVIESGNVAAATGVKLARTQVIAAYPITPQTPLTEKLSEFVSKGQMTAQYIPVESEHSALSVCIAASSTGSRTFTATSANGLLYMSEQVHWASGARLPIVMCVVNRGVGAPWTVWNDHQDSISQRDTGWIQMHACDHQQILDTVLKAFMVAEKVSIPVMVCYDGYLLSHSYMPFEIPKQEDVDRFLPSFSSDCKLDPEHPLNQNTVTLPDVRPDIHGNMSPGYMEIRHNLQQDLICSLDVVKEVEDRFKGIFNRGGSPFIESYLCEDAEYVAVCMGSLSYQLRDVVDQLRNDGQKVGVAGVRLYRPFPNQAVIDAFSGKKGLVIFEKGISYGNQGPLFTDITSALYQVEERPFAHNYILGIGGREIKTQDLLDTFRKSIQSGRKNEIKTEWIGLKL
ncbi:MAG: pyruvate ferredoxin oxidoreductase [Proteobacteria bacterium]|nr:pyruvate ferredoxin oxidoreductase [Pseudomonadota bacterium]